MYKLEHKIVLFHFWQKWYARISYDDNYLINRRNLANFLNTYLFSWILLINDRSKLTFSSELKEYTALPRAFVISAVFPKPEQLFNF